MLARIFSSLSLLIASRACATGAFLVVSRAMEWLLERARLADFGAVDLQERLDTLSVDEALLTFDLANATQPHAWLYALSHHCQQVRTINTTDFLLPNFSFRKFTLKLKSGFPRQKYRITQLFQQLYTHFLHKRINKIDSPNLNSNKFLFPRFKIPV